MKTDLKIKVCGLRDPHNIKAVDGFDIDYIGFIFHEASPRNMDKNFGAIPETNAKRVGVFVDEAIEFIIKKARNFRLNTIQLHGNESPEVCHDLADLGYEVIKAFRIDDEFDEDKLEAYANTCSYFLFDTKGETAGGTGQKFNWNKLKSLAPYAEFFLSGGIGPEDVGMIKELNIPNLIGIDVNSRFEIEPGIKKEQKLKTFITELRN